MEGKNYRLIFLIVFILCFIFPGIGQAATLEAVHINETLTYSEDPVYLSATGIYSDGSTLNLTPIDGWTTSDANIAEVYRGKVTFKNRPGTVKITFSHNGQEDYVILEVFELTNLQIEPDELEYGNKSVQLKVKGSINGGPLKELDTLKEEYAIKTMKINWDSTNKRVIDVDTSGKATFQDETGRAYITVTVEGPFIKDTSELFKKTELIEVTSQNIDDDEDEEEDEKAYTIKIDGELDPTKTTNSLKVYKLYIDDTKKTLGNDLIYWSSSNPNVAEVDDQGKVTFTGAPGNITITAKYKGRKADIDAFVPITNEELKINESLNFTPYFFKYPPRLTVTGITNSDRTQLVPSVEWSSSDEEIATIDNWGQIIFTGKSGEVTFTATKDELTAQITCTVPENEAKAIQRIYIKENLFYSEEPQEMQAFALYSNGTREEITQNATWFSNNEALATVKNNKVYFTGLPGSVEISCTYQGFSDRVKTLVGVPGRQKVLSSIKFADTFLSYQDNGKELKVYGVYSDNTKKLLSYVKYHSFQPNLAKIKGGKIQFTGVPGKGTIEVISGDFRDTLDIEVTEVAGKNSPIYLKIEGSLDNYQKTKTLKAIAVYPNGKQIDITDQAVWNTTNSNIAEIAEKGKAEFVGNGPVRISASFENQMVYLSNKAYFQFGKVHPIDTNLIPFEEVKSYAQAKLAKNSFVPTPSDIYGHWAYNDIQLARRLGWMGGYPDGSMRPDNSISRGEFASLLERALKLNTNNRFVTYSDIKEHWAKESINVIANLGIAPLDPSRKFHPNEPLTREEMALMLANLINVRADTHYSYLDVPPSHSSATAIANVTQAKIMSGMDRLYFRPNEPATRAQALAVLLRLIKTDPEMEGILNRR